MVDHFSWRRIQNNRERFRNAATGEHATPSSGGLFRFESSDGYFSSGAQSLQLSVFIDNLLNNERRRRAGEQHTDFNNNIIAAILGFNSGDDLANWLSGALNGNLGQAISSLFEPTSGTRQSDGINFDALYEYRRSEPSILRTDLNTSGTGSANFNAAINFVLQEEGGYNPNEPRGAVAMFGINSEAHPDVDVENLTVEQAIAIYKQDYWGAIPGIEQMDHAMAVTVFDTAVNCGTGRAKQFLAQSEGDINAFIQLRANHYERLVNNNPETYARYEAGWTARLNNLETHIASLPREEFGRVATGEQQEIAQADLTGNSHTDTPTPTADGPTSTA